MKGGIGLRQKKSLLIATNLTLSFASIGRKLLKTAYFEGRKLQYTTHLVYYALKRRNSWPLDIAALDALNDLHVAEAPCGKNRFKCIVYIQCIHVVYNI